MSNQNNGVSRKVTVTLAFAVPFMILVILVFSFWETLPAAAGERPAEWNPKTEVSAGTWYFVPVVSYGEGAGDSLWQTDLNGMNNENSTMDLEYYFTKQQYNGSYATVEMSEVISRRKLATENDVVRSLFDSSGTGSLRINSPLGSSLMFNNRLFNTPQAKISVGGTFGQYVPALTTEKSIGVGDPAIRLIFVERNEDFRMNVGVTEISGSPCVVKFLLYDRRGVLKASHAQDIAAFSNVQNNRFIDWIGYGGDISGARIMIQVLSGQGRIIGYASIVDEGTGDPSFSLGLLSDLDTGRNLMIPAIADARGASDSYWASDIRVHNPSNLAADVSFKYIHSATDPGIENGPFRIGRNSVRVFSAADVGASGTVGSLLIESTEKIYAVSRTYNHGSNGTFGQFIPAVRLDKAVARGDDPLFVIGLKNSADKTIGFRSNLGIVELGDHWVRVKVTLLDQNMNSLGTRRYYTIHSYRLNQISGIFREFGVDDQDYDIGAAVVEVVSGDGRVYAYGSVIDNITNDPIYIGAEQLPQ